MKFGSFSVREPYYSRVHSTDQFQVGKVLPLVALVGITVRNMKNLETSRLNKIRPFAGKT